MNNLPQKKKPSFFDAVAEAGEIIGFSAASLVIMLFAGSVALFISMLPTIPWIVAALLVTKIMGLW